jgi:hypothetical protein
MWGKIQEGFGWLVAHWPLLLAILTGPIGIAVLLITKNWDTIKAGATAAVDWVTGRFDALVAFVTGLPDRISSAARGAFDGIRDAFTATLDAMIEAWNRLSFRIPGVDSHIPGVGVIGGFTLDTPNIPLLARGGIVTSPTLAMIGEAGPEAVVPLDRLGGNTYQVNVYVAPGADPAEVGRQTIRSIEAYERSTGRRRLVNG